MIPENPLTLVLKDFRQYRPVHHNLWLHNLEQQANMAGVMDFAMENGDSSVVYLQNMDTIREFRQRHWNFTKEYIIKYSDHPTGTGGSPITTWLPNQLSAVLGIMNKVADNIDISSVSEANKPILESIQTRAAAQHRVLTKEVAELRAKFNQ